MAPCLMIEQELAAVDECPGNVFQASPTVVCFRNDSLTVLKFLLGWTA